MILLFVLDLTLENDPAGDQYAPLLVDFVSSYIGDFPPSLKVPIFLLLEPREKGNGGFNRKQVVDALNVRFDSCYLIQIYSASNQRQIEEMKENFLHGHPLNQSQIAAEVGSNMLDGLGNPGGGCV